MSVGCHESRPITIELPVMGKMISPQRAQCNVWVVTWYRDIIFRNAAALLVGAVFSVRIGTRLGVESTLVCLSFK